MAHDLRAELARLLRVDEGEVRLTYGCAVHFTAEFSATLVPPAPHTGGRYMLGVKPLRIGQHWLTRGLGPTPDAARADALARLAAGYRAVRDVLDPWTEGPPAESGVYAVECEDGTSRPGEWHTTSDEVYWLGVARPHQWPTVAGPDEERRPARCRPLDVSGP